MTTRSIAAFGVAAPVVALNGLSTTVAGAFLTLCPMLFVLFLMALLENAASRAARRAQPMTAEWRMRWWTRGCFAFLASVLTTSVALIAWRLAAALAPVAA